jgi:hypothetical protein
MRVRVLIGLATLLLGACQSSADRLPPACDLKPESGRCRAAIERFWYDPMSGTCRVFIWGGCDGVVPFGTLEDCQSTCRVDEDAAVIDKRPQLPRSY